MKRRLFPLHAICVLFLLLPANCLADVDFDGLFGSDLGMGVGAKAAGMGGAFVAIADDASAVFWNPAGLAAMEHNQLYLSAESPSDFSAAVVTFRPGPKALQAVHLTLGFGYITRLQFDGDSGQDTWSGHPSQLLDLAMINVDENFSGAIDSKTTDFRLSLAVQVPCFKRLSLGINYIFLD